MALWGKYLSTSFLPPGLQALAEVWQWYSVRMQPRGIRVSTSYFE